MKASPIFLALALFVISGCGDDYWIAVAGIHRPATTRGHAVFLEGPPKRPYDVIGIITPPQGEYETEAEAVREMLAQADKHGADAIFLESQTESGGWRWSGTSGGSLSEKQFRAKAIVWN
jgi:hypothetical protein